MGPLGTGVGDFPMVLGERCARLPCLRSAAISGTFVWQHSSAPLLFFFIFNAVRPGDLDFF